MKLGNETLIKIEKLFADNNRDILTILRLVYFPKSGKFESNFDCKKLLLLEIDDNGRTVDKAYVTDLGDETPFYEMLNVTDQGVLLLGSRRYTRPSHMEYVKGKAVKVSDKGVRGSFMIMLNLNQKISEQNLNFADKE